MNRRVVIELTEYQINLLAIAVLEYCDEDHCDEAIEMVDAVEMACRSAERLNG